MKTIDEIVVGEVYKWRDSVYLVLDLHWEEDDPNDRSWYITAITAEGVTTTWAYPEDHWIT